MALCSRVVSRSLYSPVCSYLCTEAMSKEDLDAFFAPPCTVCGSTSLDRGLFAREVELPAVKLNTPSLVSKFLSHLSHVILKYPLLKRVVSITDEEGKESKALLLLPESLRPHTLSPTDHDWITTNGGEETTHTVHLTYPDSYSHSAILRALLPESVKEVPTGFEAIGHIAHYNLRENAMPFKSIIGQVTLDKHQLIKTVVNKTDQIDNTFRFFKMEVLAGEDNLVATINENGCSFTFDFSKVYWNSRLHSEHNRLVGFLKRGESVLDVFAGVGPFSIPAAKKGCVIYANDLNPHSYDYLCENAKRNKVHKQISTYNLDGREFIRKVTELFLDQIIDGQSAMYSHVIMNLPAIAYTFLDTFRGLFSRVPHSRRRELVMPTIHCYGFSKCPNSPEQDSLNTVVKSLRVKELIKGTYSLYLVRKVAPNKTMTRVSFQLPEEVAYAQGVGAIESELGQPSPKRTRIDNY
ncbi:tRNA (guanine(37)-N1)-methyltransferase-like [Halichondria panicea]|uniref:tRNA (guanine(37)-N1)-methyltransferase-like n=1 Tax=Halichondria panicea TaxID=6063 RepID=UPI00312B5431